MKAHSLAELTRETPVAATFDVLAWEIELAGARCVYLDALIGELMQALPEDKQDKLIEGMHTVDLLSQHLMSLSAFSRRMSQNVPDHAAAPVQDAIGEITLGDLAERMFTAFGGAESARPQDADAGELDLF